jgi:ATP-binding cassette subfamily B protein
MRLMEKAATLDLEQFESSDQQDRLDRARRQVTGRASLLGLVFSQVQNVLTALSFAIGLLSYGPWLIVLTLLALAPSLLGELRFNAQSYRLDYFRTPERRQLDYVRFLGSSIETAKEVKLFGLSQFLIERFRRFAETMFVDNRRLAIKRAIWGSLFAAFGTITYYVAYGAIIWRAMVGDISLGDMTFLVGSFLRLKRALVQTFGTTKRSGTLRGSCGENCVPDFGRPIVLDAKLSEFELTFPDSVHQFNAGDGN